MDPESQHRWGPARLYIDRKWLMLENISKSYLNLQVLHKYFRALENVYDILYYNENCSGRNKINLITNNVEIMPFVFVYMYIETVFVLENLWKYVYITKFAAY